MSRFPAVYPDPKAYLAAAAPDDPVYFFSPQGLHRRARTFTDGFPGLVSYAVKANDTRPVLENLAAAGIGAFDVASPVEMARVREAAPDAVLHYNNPVRSRDEIATAVRLGVASYSVDDPGELAKLAEIIPGRDLEVAVRLHLPVMGAAYDFGDKFGAAPGDAVQLLRQVAALGFRPSMTFHPGTQCTDPGAWDSYVGACAGISLRAGVRLPRLNVGGGFPCSRLGSEPPLEAFFQAIGAAVARHFGAAPPQLVCEPGRAMVAAAFSLAARVKSRRDDALYLNDGIYGGLSEAPVMGSVACGVQVIGDSALRSGPLRDFTVFGPTCDSLDRLPVRLSLPQAVREGDYVVFPGVGAYSQSTATAFNGYGRARVATVARCMP